MEWNDPLMTYLLDFLFELNQNGLKTPLTIAGGFGLFLKRNHLSKTNERILFDRIDVVRSTGDIDIFLSVDVLCDDALAELVRDTLRNNGWVSEEHKPAQWYKSVPLDWNTGRVKFDFLLAGPIEKGMEKLTITPPIERARNKRVMGFYAFLVKEALFLQEYGQVFALAGKRTNGDDYTADIRVPHPFTYLIMKLFAYRDRQSDNIKKMGAYHAFDIFNIVGLLTERELTESVQFEREHRQETIVQEAKQIVNDHFTQTHSKGVIAIRSHELYTKSGARYLDQFLDTIAEIFDLAR